MKFKVLFLVICILFIKCSTPQKEFIKEAENHLRTILNDPSSYQPESITITDTMTILEYEKELASMNLENIDFSIRSKKLDIENGDLMNDVYKRVGRLKESQVRMSMYNFELDSLNLAKDKMIKRNDSLNMVTLDDGSIKFIYLIATYRAKNSFGAIVKSESNIQYDYNNKTFDIY